MATEIRPLFRPPRKTILTPLSDPTSACQRAAELIAQVRQEQAHITSSPQQIAGWSRSIQSFVNKALKDRDDAPLAVYRVVSWYAEHWQDSPYIPVVHSAKSLRQKFERLEAAKARLAPKTNGHHPMSLAEVLNKSGIPASRSAAFTRDLLTPAKALNLFDLEDKSALASALAALYAQVKEARDAAMLPGPLRGRLGGPFEIVRRYIAWLEEQRWRASSRVLQLSSPAFAQYRRDTQDQEGFDPIDGRTN